MPTLVVAAGGGGDAITGACLARPLGLDESLIVVTYSWDRLLVDPLPGPRNATECRGLQVPAPHVLQVTGSSEAIPPAGSSLPRLAVELPVSLLLLDPTGGVVGMARQVCAAAEFFGARDVAVVDVGGDALTDGGDQGLRSPLADQMALAACVRARLPTRLVIAAPGIDGEIPRDTVLARLAELHATRHPPLGPPDVEGTRGVFGWHPSEASGPLAAAAHGRRGRVEVRDAGDQVDLTDETAELYSAPLDLPRWSPAGKLTETTSLDECARIVRDATGISEIDYESDKAARRRGQQVRFPTTADLPDVDRYASEARLRGADYLSMRRLSELMGATTLPAFAALTELLGAERPDRYEPTIYRVGR